MSYENESYLTIGKSCGPEELKEKGSGFISYLHPVSTPEEAESFIAGLRKRYHDATHVCFAFRLGEGKEDYFRFSDDGEPGGTAGLPIYNEIKSKEFFNVLAAVIRYFGGSKLGTGGLVRAYAGAARKVMDRAEAVRIYIKKEVLLDFPYDFTGEVMQIVDRFSLEVVHREYTDKGAAMKLAVPLASLTKVAQAVADITNGKLQLQGA
jgi:uncharacterized YigZ family protein